MAAVKGVNFTKAETPSPTNILKRGQLRGKLRVYLDTYEAAALAAASTIQLGERLKKGVIIVGIIISWDALGAGVTLSVGDADTAARYINAVVTTSAGSKRSDLVDGMNYEVTGTDDDIIVITTGVGAATGTIKIAIITSEE